MRRIINLRSLTTAICLTFLFLSARAGEGENRTAYLEELWQKKGLGTLFVEWGTESPKRQEILPVYLSKNSKTLLDDYAKFARFFKDSAYKDNYASQAEVWLQDARIRYARDLSLFENDSAAYAETEEVLKVDGLSKVSSILSSNCYNLDFEDGAFTGWSTTVGIADGTPYPMAGTGYTPNVGSFSYYSKIQMYNTAGIYDPIVGGTGLPVLCPTGASWTAKLEDYDVGWGLSQITNSFYVSASKPWIEYKYAVVLEDPGDHEDDDRPFFEVSMFVNGSTEIECAAYKVIAKPKVENFALVEGTRYYWRDWTTVIIPLDDYVGQSVEINFRVGDCALGGHMGYAYIDGGCLDGTLTVNNSCSPEKTITAPEGFDHYLWTGEEIHGPNYERTLSVTKGGDYNVHLTTVTGCYTEKDVTIVGDCPEVTPSCSLTNLNNIVSSCDANSNTYNISGNVTVGGITDGYLLVRSGGQSQIIPGPFAGVVNYQINNLPSNGTKQSVELFLFTSKHFSLYTQTCSLSQKYTAPSPCNSASIVCEDCIKGFQPEPGSTYVISTWVKQQSATPLDYTYSAPSVTVVFNDGSSTTSETFAAAGEIIDGWQRISAEFTIPANTIDIAIELSSSAGYSNFDDLRIYPANGSFKTYVYDPITMRLVAELDENNYATLYEYDEEGALIRIKKETERGIMTIKENKNYKIKKP